MPNIAKIEALEIIDSRATPTLSVRVTAEDGTSGEAMVPSGASTGEHEAHEKRDGDERYNGNGVNEAMKSVCGEIRELLCGRFDITEQRRIDRAMIALDKTENKSRLGANAILGVSLATARAAANYCKMPLFRYIGGADAHIMPVPMMNILNGGRHADNRLDFQEFMIMPVGVKRFSDAVRCGCEVFYSLKKLLHDSRLSTAVGDEGGFAPDIAGAREALGFICDAVTDAGYEPGHNVMIALDAAASEFYSPIDQKYHMNGEGNVFSREEMIEYYTELCAEYPIISIEDALEQNDFDGFSEITAQLGGSIQLVGDDLFVTDKSRLMQGIGLGAANSVLIKPNQIGTLTETLETIEAAKRAGYTAVVSHRSGETADTTIADIAVGVNAGQIKTGSLTRAERTAKYNRLHEI